MKAHKLLYLVEVNPEKYYNTNWILIDRGVNTSVYINSAGNLVNMRGDLVKIDQLMAVEQVHNWKQVDIPDIIDRLTQFYNASDCQPEFMVKCEYQGQQYMDANEIHSLNWFLRLCAVGQWFTKEK